MYLFQLQRCLAVKLQKCSLDNENPSTMLPLNVVALRIVQSSLYKANVWYWCFASRLWCNLRTMWEALSPCFHTKQMPQCVFFFQWGGQRHQFYGHTMACFSIIFLQPSSMKLNTDKSFTKWRSHDSTSVVIEKNGGKLYVCLFHMWMKKCQSVKKYDRDTVLTNE